jgi:hypothetical protein
MQQLYQRGADNPSLLEWAGDEAQPPDEQY